MKKIVMWLATFIVAGSVWAIEPCPPASALDFDYDLSFYVPTYYNQNTANFTASMMRFRETFWGNKVDDLVIISGIETNFDESDETLFPKLVTTLINDTLYPIEDTDGVAKMSFCTYMSPKEPNLRAIRFTLEGIEDDVNLSQKMMNMMKNPKWIKLLSQQRKALH